MQNLALATVTPARSKLAIASKDWHDDEGIPPNDGQQVERGWRFGWIDAVVILTVFTLLWLLIFL